jgi:hypothetical protein
MSNVENALFLFDNAAMAGTISASSEVAAMPVSNLLDPQRTAVWRSSGASPQTVDITLSASNAIPIGAVAVVDHNLTAGGRIRLQGWTDGLGVGVAVVDVEVDPWESMFGYGMGGYGVGGYGGEIDPSTRTLMRPVTFIPLPDFYTARYWRFTFTDASLAYIQAGCIYVGGVWQPATNFSVGWERSRTGRTRLKKSRGGQDYGNPKPSFATLRADLNYMDSGDQVAFDMYYLRVEDHTPFIVCLRPVGGYQQMVTAIYGRFVDMKLTHTYLDNARAPLLITEAL